MSTINPTPSADTPITVKVTLGDGDSKRVKIALRDLGPNTLPEKLRQLLAVPVTQNIVLERFSDSAGTYITLDSTNLSVYKQLYRAAKAKLKLRIRVTTVESSAPRSPVDYPELSPMDRLSSNCYVPPSTPVPAKLEFPGPLTSPEDIAPPITSSEAPALSTQLAQVKAEHISRFIANNLRQETHSQPNMCPAMNHINLAAAEVVAKPTGACGGVKHAQPKTGVEHEATLPRYFSTREQFFAELASMSRDRQPRNAGPGSTFTICCNNCDVAIPNAHWHCSSCDNGDFDLCVDCVHKGVLCDSEDHWLIKRFVHNGKVTNSTTERIEPKRVTAVENVPAREAPGAHAPPNTTEVSQVTFPESRTCNSCVTAFVEENFFTCTVCEDYDLCTGCLIGMKHGHHPSHTLAKACKGTRSTSVTSDLCKSGRNVRHRATCDGCDKDIYGVRHKCLDCPDWDYCSGCMKDSHQTHPGHRFAPLWDPIQMPLYRLVRHYGIQCDGPLCVEKGPLAYIVGDRYKCAVCHDTDFCANCEASPTNRHNRTHPLIKFKTAIKNVSVTTLGEKENGEHIVTLGDQPPQTSSKSTETIPAAKLAHAATQVQSDAMIKPTERVQNEPKAASKIPESLLQVQFVSEPVVHGETILPPSTTFSQVWTLRNPGPESWPAGCGLHFIGGDALYNVDWRRPSSVSELERAARSNITNDVVVVNEEVQFKVIMKTPEDQGTTVSYWRLKDANGNPFGPPMTSKTVFGPSESTVEPELEPNQAAETVKEGEAHDEEEPGSQMIFPKLEKESPVASIHEVESEGVATQAHEKELSDDLESLALDSDDEGFLTDEEYDLLDMSDAETCVTAERN